MICSVGLASEQQDKNSKNWEIGMMPEEPAKEIGVNKWSLILENELGIYAYDDTSVSFLQDEKGKKDSNQVEVDIKTVFINKETLKLIDAKYAKQLKNGDTTSSCLIHMIFNRADKTYKTTSLQVFSKKGRELENKNVIAQFSSIPEKSFVEAMLEVINRYVAANKEEMLFNKRYLVI